MRHRYIYISGFFLCKILLNVDKFFLNNLLIYLFTSTFVSVETLEFTIDASSYPIVGEVNLLRCLSRCIDEYNYEKTLKQHDDRILDSCYCLFVTERLNGSVMNELEELEGIVSENSEILNGGLPRLPDIALWSTIRQIFPRNSQNKLPKSIKEVYRVCEEMFIENDLVHV